MNSPPRAVLKFLVITSELVQVNPDNSLAECLTKLFVDFTPVKYFQCHRWSHVTSPNQGLLPLRQES